MDAEWVAANPIGVVFDPDDLFAGYEQGYPLSSSFVPPPLPDGVSPFDMLRFWSFSECNCRRRTRSGPSCLRAEN